MKKIGIIGAGAMGKGIAKNLQKAGYDVVAHKRNIDEANDVIKYLRANDVAITSDLQSIFKSVDILLTCLPDSPTVENVLVGKEGLVNCEESSVKTVIDFSTAHPIIENGS
jgi:2-hydroxy-3-oxopropionate reductase